MLWTQDENVEAVVEITIVLIGQCGSVITVRRYPAGPVGKA